MVFDSVQVTPYRAVRTLPEVDPWWEVFLPALHGDDTQELATARAAVTEGAPGSPGLRAIVARVLFLEGRGAEARHALELALRDGCPEAERLAVHVHPDGRERALRLVRGPRPVGERADVACDLAARCLGERDVAGARASIELAAALCPEHAETRRWRRFLLAGHPVVDAWVAARQRREPSASPVLRDADALRPRAANGYVAPERVRRRICGVGGGAERTSLAGGLGRLASAGVAHLRLGYPHHYRRLAVDHPRVQAELELDQLLALVDEERDAEAVANALWQTAASVEPAVELEIARQLVSAAVQDLRLASVGLEGISLLRRGVADEDQVWDAAEAVLTRGHDPEAAVRLARRVLRRPASVEGVRLALDTLRLAGASEEARGRAQRLARIPWLAEEAAAHLALAPGAPPRRAFG